MPKPASGEFFRDIHFPKAGIDVSMAFCRQPNKPGEGGGYARTTPLAVNVRGYEPIQNRNRGGQRSGLSKYLAPRPGDVEWITQALTVIVTDGGSPVQTSQSGRVVKLIAVSQGNVYWTLPGGTDWTLAANNTGETPPLNISGLMQSAANNQKLYFADGINYVFYDPRLDTVFRWTASAGTLPADSNNNTPRLICTWRGRTVLSGLILDPQNWFMSAVADPTDWDYSPLSVTPTQAVAGNNSPLGFIGDVVTALIPYSDDVLIFGGDHTIYIMHGDPMAGGQIDRVSDVIGIAWGEAWCKDPYGNVFFVSNRTGIYTMVPGQQPQRISQPIEQILQNIDTGASGIRLIWDDRFQGLHVFVTTLATPGPAVHYFYEVRSGAWFLDVFGNNNHNPLCCCTLDGNRPGDRVPLIGSWDGYVRTLDPEATTDDGTAISSTVIIGPMRTENHDDLLLKEMLGVLAATSGDVQYKVYVGHSAEEALETLPVATGTWKAGRNPAVFTRWAGHAIYVQLSSSVPWALEEIRLKLVAQGKVRARTR